MEENSLKPISQRPSIVEDVIREICDYILGGVMKGTLHKGDKIPSERELSEQLSIGRSTLREAIKVLVMLGLLVIRKGQGTFISDGNNGFYTAPLEWGLIIGYKSISELIEVRGIVDCEAAFLASQRADEEDIQRISKTFSDMQAALRNCDIKSFMVNDVEFHMDIARATKNTAIFQMVKTIRRLLEIWIEQVLVDEDSLKITYAEHAKIYTGILSGDAEGARLAMREHISAASMRLKKVSSIS